MESIEVQLQSLRQAVQVLESQRTALGKAVVDPALAGLRSQISALEAQVAVSPKEERRIVTVLFSDVVGSTNLAEQMDPEEWHEIMSKLLSLVATSIQDNHGLVLQYLGDGLLALFGAHSASERDPEYAICAALEAQQAVASSGFEQQIHIRIGIHSGMVLLGEIGSDAHKEFSAMEDTMNLAARLQSSAPQDGILISHDTYRYVRGVFDVTPQPLISVKGKRKPIQTYLIQRAKPHPFRTANRGINGIDTSLVGREAELERLQSAYVQAYENHRFAWCQLIGEPGLGKSRLLVEMADYLDLRSENIRLLRGRAFDGDYRQPFGIIRRMWFERFQIAEDAPLPEAEAKWVEKFKELGGPGREDEAHALGLLAGLKFSDSPYIGAMRHDPIQVKGRAFVASRSLIRTIRQDIPLVILLDDMQWLDESSWEYIVQIFLEQPEREEALQALFILGAARAEWSPPQALFQHPNYDQINLCTLSDAACFQLVRALLNRIEDMPEEVIEMIVNRAEGVPYYAEEIVNWFLDRGIIDIRGENWHFLPESLGDSLLPTTLQHLLFTRLSSLEEVERAALQRGSIFGRNFWCGGLQTLGVQNGESVLEGLQPRGFVDRQPESMFEGEIEWGFHHNLIRDVAYESLLKRERIKLHKSAAAWLEDQARQADRVNDFAGVLGRHAELSGDASNAADWYLQAGIAAKDRGALREARQFFDQTLRLLPVEDRERCWKALNERSKVLNMVGDSEALRDDAAALLELAQETNNDEWIAEGHTRWGVYLSNRGDEQKAVSAFEVGLDAARRAGNNDLAAKLLGPMTISYIRIGDLKAAMTIAKEALHCLSETDDELTQSKILNNLAVYYGEIGDIPQAIYLISQAVEIYHRLGDLYGELVGLSNLGYDYVVLGLPERGQAALERAIELGERIGARRTIVYSHINLGLAHMRHGDLHNAQNILEKILPDAIAVGDTFAHAACLTYLALVYEHIDKLAEAVDSYSKSRELYSQLGARAFANDALSGLVRCALAQEKIQTTQELTPQLWVELQQGGPKGMEFPIWAYLTCALAFEKLGETELYWSALETGYNELIQRADKISDVLWRKSYLENIPEHHSITILWKERSS